MPFDFLMIRTGTISFFKAREPHGKDHLSSKMGGPGSGQEERDEHNGHNVLRHHPIMARQCFSNVDCGRGFVRMSAIWSFVLILYMVMSPE